MHDLPMAAAPFHLPVIPGRVQAAMGFLHFAEGCRNPPPMFDGQRQVETRNLSDKEQSVYNAALEVMRAYFSGEMDYGDAAPTAAKPREGDGPPQVPVPN